MLLIHLNDHSAFHKVLPSKLFEYAATGKPILAGVAGISAEFLRSEVPGSFVFDPCDAKAMARAIEEARAMLQPVDRGTFLAKYTRSNIMAEMARDLIDFVEEASNTKKHNNTA
jgi:glycosyltransferase involved in cell wall biosynthesis